MKTRALAVLVPLLALAGCADNNVSIQITTQCAPPVPTAEGCNVDPACGTTFLGTSAVDLAQTPTFLTYLQVRNQMLDNKDESAGRLNTHDAYIDEYTVDYDAVGVTLPSVTVRVNTGPVFVPVESQTVFALEPLPFDVGAQLDSSFPAAAAFVDVLARIRLRGRLADQTEFETAEYAVPFVACYNCVPFPTCTDPTAQLRICPQPGQSPLEFACITESEPPATP